MTTPASVARAHGWFNLVSGTWPLVHRRSFEGITGPKTDVWLLQTVSGLLVVIGWAQIRGAGRGAGTAQARRLGTGAALTLFVVDVRYATSGRIPLVYLLDATFQALWLNAWFRSSSDGRCAQTWPRKELLVDLLDKTVYATATGIVTDITSRATPSGRVGR